MYSMYTTYCMCITHYLHIFEMSFTKGASYNVLCTWNFMDVELLHVEFHTITQGNYSW